MPVTQLGDSKPTIAAQEIKLDESTAPVFRRTMLTCTYVALWTGLSVGVIMQNKYIISYTGFPYPILLTMWHMLVCSLFATVVVKGKYVEDIHMSTETYLRAIVPIGICYAGTLWLGNATYFYLSVAFIQMLKALAPVAVFTVGCAFGTNTFKWSSLLNMLLITTGVAIASYGEVNFNGIGVMFQLGSIVTESVRLVLIQILLQSHGVQLNPITALYYVAPCCLAFLTLPFLAFEYERIVHDAALKISALVFLSNAIFAVGLNISAFLLIGKTSALTMNIAGVLKVWLLVGLSFWIFRSPVSQLNLIGFSIAFAGVCWYNLKK